MSCRGRLEIGTYGDISTTRTSSGTVRAEARYRDGDGMVRKVTATAATAKQAKQSLRLKLRRRNTATGFGELEANAAARRLKRRLARAGIPPRQVHPTTAAERRANDRAASAYFGDPTLGEHLRRFTVFAETLTEHMLEHGASMREFAEAYAARRPRMGLPSADVERIVYARAVEVVTEHVRNVDLLTSRDVAAACRSTQAVMRNEERRDQYERLLKTLVAHIERDFTRLAIEAAFENRARRQHGRPTAPLESLVIQLATQELLPKLRTTHPTVEDARAAGREAKARIGSVAATTGGAPVDRDRYKWNLSVTPWTAPP